MDGLGGFFHSSSLIAVYDFVWTPMFLAIVSVLDPLLGWACLIAMGVIVAAAPLRLALTAVPGKAAAAASRETAETRAAIGASRDTIRGQGMGGALLDRRVAARAPARRSPTCPPARR